MTLKSTTSNWIVNELFFVFVFIQIFYTYMYSKWPFKQDFDEKFEKKQTNYIYSIFIVQIH